MFATYTDLGGTVRPLRSPCCDEPMRTGGDPPYESDAQCRGCSRIILANELAAMAQHIENLDTAAVDFAHRSLLLASGAMVPSPFGSDPIDMDVPTVPALRQEVA